MSSSFRNLSTARVSSSAAAGICFAGLIACPAAGAAQYTFQPNAELTAEEHTNLGMDPEVSKKLEETYFATAGAVIGIDTLRSKTTLKPQVSRPYYADQDSKGTTEGKFDLNSYYSSLRSTVSVTGRFDRRDEIRGELPDAKVDELNPNATNPTPPTNPETGRTLVGAKRDQFFISPGYTYNLNQIFAIDATAMYQTINYSGVNNPSVANDFVDFTFYKAAVALRKSVTERADVSAGPYFARYESGGSNTHTDGTGGAVSFNYKWSQTQYAGINVFMEREDYGKQAVAGQDSTANAYGAEFTMAFKQLISGLYLNLGRNVTPSGSGGVYYSDQLQVQYVRDLSQRSGMLAAVRYLNDHSVVGAANGNVLNANDRKYAQADLEYRYQLTQTVYVRVGYEYTWQEYKIANEPAHDHRIGVSIGYEGLSQRSR